MDQDERPVVALSMTQDVVLYSQGTHEIPQVLIQIGEFIVLNLGYITTIITIITAITTVTTTTTTIP